MSAQAEMTLTDLLFYLRHRLLDAAERHDQSTLVELQNALVLLQEAAWQGRDEGLAALTQNMIDAVSDALIGVEWKSAIPPVSAIEARRSSTPD
jgi:hypothetical protein